MRVRRQEADRCLFKHNNEAEESEDQEQVCVNVTASGQVWNGGCASSSGDHPL